MVAAAHPLATAAGVRMLERGGNAADAAVAAAFALSVVEPSMSGLGGRTQLLLRLPDGSVEGVDATTQAPASYDDASAPRARYGYGVVGVPGTVAGLVATAERYGSLPLATLLEPAIALARDGFRLLPGEALRQAAVADQLAESEGGRRYFLREDGTPRPAGTLWVQEDLARVLEAIADEGADVFYRGWIARRIAEDVAAHGGHVTMASLADYGAEEARIVRGSYRGHELAGLWVPSYGAITIEILHLLETLDMAGRRGGDWAAAVHEAVRVAYRDRGAQNDWSDARRITSKRWARQRATEMRLEGGAPAGRSGRGDPGPPAWEENPGHTSHLTTADGRGMMVALTQSNGPNMGSRVATPGLGFLYAATLGGYLGAMAPGERARSHISPFLVLRDGEPYLALGAAGGGRIPPAIVAVISRLIDHGMSLGEALAAPRAVPDGDELDAETNTGMGFTAADLDRLGALGFAVDAVAEEGAFGRVHAVLWTDDGWVGGADPDWEGSAAGPGGG